MLTPLDAIDRDPNLRLGFDETRTPVILVGDFDTVEEGVLEDPVARSLVVTCSHELEDLEGALACAIELRLEDSLW